MMKRYNWYIKKEGSKGPRSIVQPLLKTHVGPLGMISLAVTAAIFIFSPTATLNCCLLKTIKEQNEKKEEVRGWIPLLRFSKYLR